MPISIAEKLLVSILKKKAIKVLPKVQEKWFDKKELPCYRVIMDHFRAHGELLGYKSFCDKFGFDYKEVDSSPDAYLTDVKNRYTYTKLAEKIPPILRRDENDIEDSLRAITELVSELNSSDLHSTETRFSENAEERFNDYFDLKSNKGITYLSTGSEVLDTLLLGYRRQDLVTFAARAGGKKCFGKDTKVRMYDGTVKVVQDIKVGDVLMGDDGSKRNVLKLYEGDEMMYEVHQNKGMTYTVNESHILTLKNKRPINICKTTNGKKKYIKSGGCTNEIVNITVREYLTMSKTWKKYHKGYKSQGLHFRKQDVLIDPYFLGLWLGDGGAHKIEITSNDHEIVSYIENYAKELSLKVTVNKNQYSITTGNKKSKNPLVDKFRKYNLLNNKSNLIDEGCKRIPTQYLRNTRKVRLQVLAGLLDTDGCYSEVKKGYLITQKSKLLADDIAFLARGLGYQVSQNDEAIAKLKSRNYTCKVSALFISGNLLEVPTKVKRKKPTKRLINKDSSITGITVTKKSVDHFYGFELDGNHLFCLEDLTVVHNTFLMCYLALLCEKAMTNATYGDILFITNEVPAKEIIQRMDSIKYKLPYNDFIHGTLSGKKEIAYHKGLEKLSASKSVIQILENVTTIDALSAKVLLYQPAIVFLDGSYLLESSYKGDDWKKILYITRNLKQIAKDTGVPIINTTQLKRASGKSKKGSFDAQDDFAYGNSYVQDSDAAFTGFIDADMQYRGDVGYQIAKGRRMSESEYPIFECPLHSMELNIKLNEDDEVAETEEVDY